jgi:hypothetical protein
VKPTADRVDRRLRLAVFHRGREGTGRSAKAPNGRSNIFKNKMPKCKRKACSVEAHEEHAPQRLGLRTIQNVDFVSARLGLALFGSGSVKPNSQSYKISIHFVYLFSSQYLITGACGL